MESQHRNEETGDEDTSQKTSSNAENTAQKGQSEVDVASQDVASDLGSKKTSVYKKAFSMKHPGVFLTELNDQDVLQGRGSGSNLFHGNMVYRDMIDEIASSYTSTACRTEKNRLVKVLIKVIHHMKGRFLHPLYKDEAEKFGLDPKKDFYVEITDADAVDKVKQAIRYVHYKKRPLVEQRPRQAVVRGGHHLDDGRQPPKQRVEESSSRGQLKGFGTARLPVELMPGLSMSNRSPQSGSPANKLKTEASGPSKENTMRRHHMQDQSFQPQQSSALQIQLHHQLVRQQQQQHDQQQQILVELLKMVQHRLRPPQSEQLPSLKSPLQTQTLTVQRGLVEGLASNSGQQSRPSPSPPLAELLASLSLPLPSTGFSDPLPSHLQLQLLLAQHQSQHVQLPVFQEPDQLQKQLAVLLSPKPQQSECALDKPDNTNSFLHHFSGSQVTSSVETEQSNSTVSDSSSNFQLNRSGQRKRKSMGSNHKSKSSRNM